MIFVTVGSDIPFDRLIRTVDYWAQTRIRPDVFAQIGLGGWQPEFISFMPMLQPAEFRERLANATIVVGHAGMGTILSALQHTKPILVMPRRGFLGETRNDHQMATARQLLEMGKINAAFDEDELLGFLDRIEELTPKEAIQPYANSKLVRALNGFIHQKQVVYNGKG
jgi:UDP-N-acetylglucosamine transferase subunit ALG13